MTIVTHQAKSIYEADLLDAVKCSCGWRSKWFYDGREYAQNEWKRHVAEASALPSQHGKTP